MERFLFLKENRYFLTKARYGNVIGHHFYKNDYKNNKKIKAAIFIPENHKESLTWEFEVVTPEYDISYKNISKTDDWFVELYKTVENTYENAVRLGRLFKQGDEENEASAAFKAASKRISRSKQSQMQSMVDAVLLLSLLDESLLLIEDELKHFNKSSAIKIDKIVNDTTYNGIAVLSSKTTMSFCLTLHDNYDIDLIDASTAGLGIIENDKKTIHVALQKIKGKKDEFEAQKNRIDFVLRNFD